MGSSIECQCRLPAFTFRVEHAIDTDSLSWVDVGHVLRSNQYVLLLIAIVGGVDLCGNRIADQLNECYHISSRTIIFMLIRRLTASMKTSNSSGMRDQKKAASLRLCLPRHLKGQPIASHNDCKRQIVENDFSPPLRDLASFSLACVPAWSSV